MSGRTLPVFARTGLSNRINVLISGLALAAAAGREFRMLWPRTPACGASFAELFANDWAVEEVDAQALNGLPYGWSRHDPVPPDRLAASAETFRRDLAFAALLHHYRGARGRSLSRAFGRLSPGAAAARDVEA